MRRCVVMAYLCTKRRNSGLVEIESVCRRHNDCNLKKEILSGTGRKHCGKRRKRWLPAFSPFPTMFSIGSLFRVIKSQDYVVKG